MKMVKVKILKNFAWYKEGQIEEVDLEHPQTKFLLRLKMIEVVKK